VLDHPAQHAFPQGATRRAVVLLIVFVPIYLREQRHFAKGLEPVTPLDQSGIREVSDLEQAGEPVAAAGATA
jgi:hypothetical protein